MTAFENKSSRKYIMYTPLEKLQIIHYFVAYGNVELCYMCNRRLNFLPPEV